MNVSISDASSQNVNPKVAAWDAIGELYWNAGYRGRPTTAGIDAYLADTLGRANYAAANCVLDGLAERRTGLGLPAHVIGWGPWADTGLATESGERGRAIWDARGTQYIEPDHGIELLESILAQGLRQSVVTITEWPLWLEQYRSEPPLLRTLGKEAPAKRRSSRPGNGLARLAQAAAAERGAVLQGLIADLVRESLAIQGDIDVLQSLREQGLDSLMAIVVINKIEAAFEIRLPAAFILSGPSITQLAAELHSKLNDGAVPPAPELQAPAAPERADGHVQDSAVARPAIGAAGKWVVRLGAAKHARCRLVCFPFAGAGPGIFRGWANLLDGSVDLLGIEPPGRSSRTAETPVTRMSDFLAGVVPELLDLFDRPVAFFGHCIGGVTMFETARALIDEHGLAPVHLFASGARPPHRLITDGPFEKALMSHLLELPDFLVQVPSYRQSNEVFAEIIRHFQIDQTEKMLSMPELSRILLPVVRAEFEMASRYDFPDTEPWDIPITCFHGSDDPYVTREDALAWGQLTARDFVLLSRPGAHFGVVDDRDHIVGVVAGALHTLTRATGGDATPARSGPKKSAQIAISS